MDTITINGKTADITLETERTVGEFLSGIDSWLQGSGQYLSGLTVNGASVDSLAMDQAFALSLDEITTMDIKTSRWTELILEALLALQEDLEKVSGGSLAGASGGRYPAEWETCDAGVFLSNHARDIYEAGLKSFKGDFPVPGTLQLVGERIRELQDPGTELAELEPLITGIVKRLEDLPLDIQTGKDSRAAETVSLFSGIAEKFLRLLRLLKEYGLDLENITVEAMAIEDYIEEFSAALEELLTAYESKDTVLVGDLAEYELAPRLLKLYSALAASVKLFH
jgi:hypothetical protein